MIPPVTPSGVFAAADRGEIQRYMLPHPVGGVPYQDRWVRRGHHPLDVSGMVCELADAGRLVLGAPRSGDPYQAAMWRPVPGAVTR